MESRAAYGYYGCNGTAFGETERGPMTYREIWDNVQINHIEGAKETTSHIAQLVYGYGYGDEESPSKEDAVWIALELYEDMTGRFYDPTHEEFDEIVSQIMEAY